MFYVHFRFFDTKRSIIINNPSELPSIKDGFWLDSELEPLVGSRYNKERVAYWIPPSQIIAVEKQ